MSATVWPPISHEQLIKEEEDTLAAELQWLLELLQENLASLKSGLQECVALLAPEEPGSTLVLSSLRSESVKGFVTRVGTRIVKGDISLRLPTLPLPRNQTSYPLRWTTPTPLPQLSHLLTLLNTALDIIDISAWTGDPQNAPFISGQLKLLSDSIAEARNTLNGDEDVPRCRWWEDGAHDDPSSSSSSSPTPASTGSEPAPAARRELSAHFGICDAALILTVRTLGPSGAAAVGVGLTGSFSGLSIRTRLGLAAKPAVHDEMGQVFVYAGEEVSVKEKVRVESQDPSLMAVMAKLSALGHAVAGWRLKVGVLMGEEVDV